MSYALSPSNLTDPDYLQLPALPPSPGVTPNFARPEGNGSLLVFVNGTLSALMLILIAIRVYTKISIVQKFSWDDLTIFSSAFSACALYILFVWGIASPYPIADSY